MYDIVKHCLEVSRAIAKKVAQLKDEDGPRLKDLCEAVNRIVEIRERFGIGVEVPSATVDKMLDHWSTATTQIRLMSGISEKTLKLADEAIEYHAAYEVAGALGEVKAMTDAATKLQDIAKIVDLNWNKAQAMAHLIEDNCNIARTTATSI